MFAFAAMLSSYTDRIVFWKTALTPPPAIVVFTRGVMVITAFPEEILAVKTAIGPLVFVQTVPYSVRTTAAVFCVISNSEHCAPADGILT